MADEDHARSMESPPSLSGLWPEVLELPCHLGVELQVPGFTIRDLLSLDVDSVVDTERREGAHVPVVVNGVMVAWAEFDVMEDRLAVRLTEIA
jgi:flagellar motor switch protein FliN/FliY